MRLLPVSLDALLVELNDLDETLALFEALQQAPVEGVIDMVPAARTLLIRFDPTVCSRDRLVAAVVSHRGLSASCGAASTGDLSAARAGRLAGALVQVPVRYDGEDLDDLAAHLRVSRSELIRRHAAVTWQVAFCGFAPGFAYMTCSDPLFNVPRRASPRTRIPAGSVALAGQFCGIYPRATPGGWQLIGTTDVPMWDLGRNPPAFLQPGQRVQFVDADTEAGGRILHEILSGSPLDAGQAESGTPAKHADSEADAHPGDAADGRAAQRGVGPQPVCRREVRCAAAEDAGSSASDAAPDFEVITPGLQAIFQDLGRPGQAGQGVSASGALDRRAFLLANRLVGNHRNAAALELLHGGFRLQANVAAVMAVTGAAGPVQLQHADGTQVSVPRDEPFSVEPGDALSIGAPQAGVRSYLAVRGGFSVPDVLGSCATDTLAGVGPEPLVAGVGLRVGNRRTGPVLVHPQAVSHDDLPGPEQQRGDEEVMLDIVPGPRADWFSEDAMALLLNQSWLVTQQSNRVGLRLQGEQPLARATAFVGRELPSEGTVVGALQIPANGQPVLFLADHPLTGGYPVIACVAPHHLDLAGQLPAGVRLRFRAIAPFAEMSVPPDAS